LSNCDLNKRLCLIRKIPLKPTFFSQFPHNAITCQDTMHTLTIFLTDPGIFKFRPKSANHTL